MLKMYMIFEVLCLIGTVFGTASVVQIIIKYSLYGHVLPVKEKHLSDWPIISIMGLLFTK